MDSNLTVSVWPLRQSAGAFDSLMGRRSSKASSQVLQRYSYTGISEAIVAGANRWFAVQRLRK